MAHNRYERKDALSVPRSVKEDAMTSTYVRRSPRARRPSPTLSYGDRVEDRYIINGFAGTGATSYVYRARHMDSFEPVAIKVLHPHLLRDPIKRRRFLREAEVMMQMAHPNVVRFHEIIEREDMLAFVMEYIDGQTLSDWQSDLSGELEEIELACVFVDILRGLSHAHYHGVVHRDLKPANVLITFEDGRHVAKIIDFGVAKLLAEPTKEEDAQKIVGTAAYISPEEVSDPDAVCPASDLYSIGVMLYEAACGRRPFQGMPVGDIMEAHVEREPPKPREFNPDLSPAFESVILRTLSKRPDGRFESAPEMIRALELALQGAMAMTEEEWQEVAEDEEAMTTEWHRAIERAANKQRNAVLGFVQRCLQNAFLLLTSTGAHGRSHDPHYSNRSAGPDLPLF